MGWWKLETWKEDSKGNNVDLTDEDIENIVNWIRKGCSEGDICDGD